MTTDELLNQGIAALKAGRKVEARSLLMQVVQQDERSEMAWLWFSGAVDTDEDRRICLENVLAINPNNEAARRGLAMLQQRQVSQPTKVESPRGKAQLETAKDGAAFSVSEPTSTRSQWVMLEEDTRGKFVRTGFLFPKYYFRSGKLRTRTEIRKKDYQELLQLQEETPVVVMRGKGDRTWWMFWNEFYLDDESHIADEVKWLILHPFTRLVNLWRQREKLEQQAERLLRQRDRLMGLGEWILDSITEAGPGPLPTEGAVEYEMLRLGFTTEDIKRFRTTPGVEYGKHIEGKWLGWVNSRLEAIRAEMGTIPTQMESILAHVAQVKVSTGEMKAIPAQVEAILAEIEVTPTLVETVMAHVAQVKKAEAEDKRLEAESWAVTAHLLAEEWGKDPAQAWTLLAETYAEELEVDPAEVEAVLTEFAANPAEIEALLAETRGKRREPIPGWMRRAVLDRDQGICRYCGRRAMTLHLDHVVPVSQGGHSTVDNLVTACAKCNRHKAGCMPEEAGMALLPPGTHQA